MSDIYERLTRGSRMIGSDMVVDSFGDGELGAAAGIDVGVIGGGGIRKPVALPIEQERLKTELEEDQDEGIVDEDGKYITSYACEMCRVGNQAQTQETSETLRRMYEMHDLLFAHLPAGEIHNSMANFWNKTLYKISKALNHKYGIRKLTKAAVRLHMTKHKKNPVMLLWNDALFFDMSMEQLKHRGMWEQCYDQIGPNKEDITPNGPPEINGKQWKTVKEMAKEKRETLKLMLEFQRQKEKDQLQQNNFMANNIIFKDNKF